MFDIKFTNNASTKLASILSDSATSLTITTGDGDKFPALVGDEYFIGTLVRGDGALEYVKVTARTGDTMTIERAQEGTTAVAFSADDVFELRLTAGSLNTILNIPSATESVEGTTQFATDVEITTGTEAGKAISPLRFQGYMDSITVDTPTLTLPASATEGTTVNGTYSIESGATPAWTIPTAITDFIDDSLGNITFTAPDVETDTAYTLHLAAAKVGALPSFAASSTITITNVPIIAGPTIAIANTTEGWSGASVTDSIVTAPATSVGTNNTAQFVSAIPEITQTNSNLEISNATIGSFDTTANYTGPIITDQGEEEIISTSLKTPSSDTEYGAPDATSVGTGPGTYIPNTAGSTIPAGTKITHLGTQIPVGEVGTGILFIARLDDTTHFTPVTTLSYSHTGSGSGITDYFELSSPYTIPDDGFVYKSGIQFISGQMLYVSGTSYIASPAMPELVVDSSFVMVTNSNTIHSSAKAVTPDIYTATLAQSLPGVPTEAFKKADPLIKIGAGATGEYLGPEITLNMYANYGSDLIPTMVAPTTSGWTITANVEDPSWPAWYVGDDVTEGINQWYTNDAATVPKTLSVVAPSGVDVGRFRMKAYVNNISYFPKDYVLRGRLGGGSWVDLVSVVDGVLPGIETGYWVEHDFASGTYDSFELNITKSHRDGLGTGSPNDVSVSEIELNSATEQSTTTSILVESSESIKDNVYIDGGLHNNLLVDGVERVVNAASEVENGGVYITTITPSIELPAVPTVVSIPNRCTLTPVSYSYVISGDDLKTTGAEIALDDNPALKRLAMAVESTDLLFRDGKIYTEEVA